MFARITRGISMPFSSFSYMTEKKLWGYAVFPLLLTGVIVAGMALVVWLYVLSYISQLLNFDNPDLPGFVRTLIQILGFILKIIILYFSFVILMRLYLSLFGVVVIPFLSPLVEKILEKEGLNTISINKLEWAGYFFSAIVYSVKMLLWQTLVAIVLIFTGPLQPVLNFIFSSYYMGRSYFDYVHELLGHPKEFNNMIKGLRVEATGVGVFSTGFIFIPLIGPIFAPVLSTVAATRLFVERSRKNP